MLFAFNQCCPRVAFAMLHESKSLLLLFSGTIGAVFWRLSFVFVPVSMSHVTVGLLVCDKLLFYTASFECCYMTYDSRSDALFCKTRMAVGGFLSFSWWVIAVVTYQLFPANVYCCQSILYVGRRLETDVYRCQSITYVGRHLETNVYFYLRLFIASYYAYAKHVCCVSALCSLCTIITNGVLPYHMHCCWWAYNL